MFEKKRLEVGMKSSHTQSLSSGCALARKLMVRLEAKFARKANRD